jgi:molybdopterin converting factor small subunit
MKVELELFVPELPEAIGRRDLLVTFDGETVGDLIGHLVAQYGRKAEQALFEGDRLDPVLQILLNGERWVTHDRLDTALRDGDSVILMMLMGGG